MTLSPTPLMDVFSVFQLLRWTELWGLLPTSAPNPHILIFFYQYEILAIWGALLSSSCGGLGDPLVALQAWGNKTSRTDGRAYCFSLGCRIQFKLKQFLAVFCARFVTDDNSYRELIVSSVNCVLCAISIADWYQFPVSWAVELAPGELLPTTGDRWRGQEDIYTTFISDSI